MIDKLKRPDKIAELVVHVYHGPDDEGIAMLERRYRISSRKWKSDSTVNDAEEPLAREIVRQALTLLAKPDSPAPLSEQVH